MRLKFSLHWNVGFRQSWVSYQRSAFLSHPVHSIWLTALGVLSRGQNSVNLLISKSFFLFGFLVGNLDLNGSTIKSQFVWECGCDNSLLFLGDDRLKVLGYFLLGVMGR